MTPLPGSQDRYCTLCPPAPKHTTDGPQKSEYSVSSEQQHALLRIAREAMANAVRHGRAGQLYVSLRQDGDRRFLIVEDDGKGFDVGAATGANAGYGLISMRERAQTLPGTLDITSQAGQGSVVTVTW